MNITNRFYMARLLGRGLPAETKMEFILAKVRACVNYDQVVDLSMVGLDVIPVGFIEEVLKPLINEFGLEFFKSHIRLSGVSSHDRFALVNALGDWVHEIIC